MINDVMVAHLLKPSWSRWLQRRYSEYSLLYPCGTVGRAAIEAASGGEGVAGGGDGFIGHRVLANDMEARRV